MPVRAIRAGLPVVLALVGFAFAAPAAYAQVITISANPSSYNSQGQIITFTYELSNPTAFTITSIDTITPSNPDPANGPGVSASCPAIPGGTLEPNETMTCSGTYAITSANMSSGNLSHTITMSGQRIGGGWNANSNFFSMSQQGGGPTITTVQSQVNPTTAGANATFNASVSSMGCNSGLAPSGTMTFTIGSVTSGAITVVPPSGISPSANASFSTTALPVGSHPVSAQFTPSGSDNCAASSGTGANHVVKSDTTTQIASSLNPSTGGTSVTFTATVTATSGGGTPTGNVTFTIDGAPQTPVAVNGSGQATLTTSSLAVGTRSIGATYNGDTVHNSSSAAPLSQTVNQVATTTVLASSANPSNVGAAVTFTATVAPVSGSGTPTGTVTFTIDGAPQTPIPVNGSGQAALTTSSLAVGPHTIGASYSGDANNISSTATALTQTVNQIATTTVIASSANPSSVGASVTFTATVTPNSGGGTPTGTVTFTIDGTPQTPIPVNGSGQATISTSALAVGPHTIGASYSGDTNNVSSTATALTQTVNQIATTTALVSSINPSNVGTSVTFTATVTANSGGGTPTGTVTFTIDGAPQAPVALNGSGQATFSTAALVPGGRTIGASYSGDVNYVASSNSLAQTVNQIATTTALASSANPSNVGDSVTFTATVAAVSGGGTPTGTVTFTVDGAPQAPVALNGSGQGTFSTAALVPGGRTIGASYSGDVNYVASNDSLTQTVNQIATTTALASSANPSSVGDSVTFTATVTANSGGGTPTGTVTFTVDGAPQAPVALNGSGQASFSTAGLAIGSRSIGASYSGDTNYVASNDALTQTVNQIGTTVSLASSQNPSSLGDSVTFTATVAATTGGSTPTGTVTFSVDGTPQAPVPLDGSGQASFSTAALAPGAHAIAADYSGDTNYVASNTSLTQTVDQIGTTTSLASSLNPSAPGDSVTFTATVVAASGGGTPTGTITFTVDGTPQTPVTLDGSGQASLTTAALASGAHTIAADYSGDTDYVASTASLIQTVNQIGTTTALASSLNPSNGGDSVTFTAMVTAVSGGGTPTGTVTFTVDGTAQAPVTLDGSGQATFTTASLAPGSKTIEAAYSGDTTYTGSTDTLTQTVEQIATTTALASSQNPSNGGDSVTFVATVAAASGGGTPTGTVTFTVDGVAQAPVALDGNGQASFATDALAPGNRTIEAAYSGDAAYTASSDALTQTVDQIGTTTALTSSQNPSNGGDSVTFNATVAAASGGGTPTGTVTFTVDGVAQAPVALDGNGQANFATDALAPGNRTIEAAYSGDAAYTASSDTLTQTVDQIGTTTALVSSANPSTVGETVTFTATIAAASGGGTPTGTVTFSIDGTAQAPVALDASGQASVSTTTLSPGSRQVEAAYGGDTTYLASSDTLSQTVNQVATTTVVTSSSNPSNLGESVSFTATVAPVTGSGTPTGTVTFTIDGTAQPAVALSGGTAVLTTNALSGGDHTIVATYNGGSGYSGSTSPSLLQRVRALGTVVIRQTVSGTDSTFDFSSATPELNLSIATANGSGQSGPIGLMAGSYVVTAGDRRVEGYALVGIACDDGDSAGNIEARTATINLTAGETVTCTFNSLSSADKATQMIGEFLEARGALILSHQTDMQRRIDRLNGTAPSMGNPVSMLSAYLPGIVDGGVLSMSTSLAQVDRLAGKEKQSRFDIWFEGTYGRFDGDSADGKFAVASVGADYLVNRNLLVGAFFQVDHLSQSPLADGSFVRGTGWLAGPYVTARLSEHLFLDVVGAAGTSQNTINPLGTFTDDFDARRWLASAQLSGQWTHGAWTFAPRAGLSWFGERTKAYVDSLGVTVPSVDYSVGQFAFGPGVSYRHLTESGYVIEPKLRLEGVAEFRNEASGGRSEDFHARIQAGTDIRTPGGASLGLTFTYSGIGGDTRSYSGKIGVSVPLN
ncbi:Ig-like domain repeat protein [Neoaquamicrobium sediminum]|uniref:Ig-like domain repeat protein n=1 Tax=Neoaquamicrobium sediminum TaxID=1849104 RepID=A0ABV3WX84_9HYPH